MVYSFFEWDYINNEDSCHMTRNHYLTLLDVCLKYSSFFSLRTFHIFSAVSRTLEGWIVRDNHFITGTSGGTVYYRLNEETRDILAKYMQNVFCFAELDNFFAPEDFSCYRTDGTQFLNTNTHKGICNLYPQTNEDITPVLAFGDWYSFDDNGNLTMPAKLIKIKLPTASSILTDPFYLTLLELKQNPCKYLSELTLKELEVWISNYWPPQLGKKVSFPPNVNILPKWYTAFKFYVLSRCNALTSDSLSEALERSGFIGSRGYDVFFSMLNTFVENHMLE